MVRVVALQVRIPLGTTISIAQNYEKKFHHILKSRAPGDQWSLTILNRVSAIRHTRMCLSIAIIKTLQWCRIDGAVAVVYKGQMQTQAPSYQ